MSKKDWITIDNVDDGVRFIATVSKWPPVIFAIFLSLLSVWCFLVDNPLGGLALAAVAGIAFIIALNMAMTLRSRAVFVITPTEIYFPEQPRTVRIHRKDIAESYIRGSDTGINHVMVNYRGKSLTIVSCENNAKATYLLNKIRELAP